MRASHTGSGFDRSPLQWLLATALVAGVFWFVGGFSWLQIGVVLVFMVLADADGLSASIPGLDERRTRIILGAVLLGLGGFVVWRGGNSATAVIALPIGGWLVLDGIHSLRAGVRLGEKADPDTSEDVDLEASEAMLTMQVGHLVADELRDQPGTVSDLATRCDMTESRVQEVLDLMASQGTATCDNGVWTIDESRIGIWPFVRDNGRWILGRLARPFQLFDPR